MRQRRHTETLVVRFEPDVIEAIEKLRVGNEVKNTSEMVRLLVRRGIQLVERAPGDRPVLTREQAAQRAGGLMQAMSDLLSDLGAHDQEAALLVGRGARNAFDGWLASTAQDNTARAS